MTQGKEQVSKAEFIEFLSEISPLTKEAKKELFDLCFLVHIKKNEDLQSVGQPCRTIFFVNHGIARIYYYRDSKDVSEYFAFKGEVITRAQSLLHGKPSHKAIQGVTTTCSLWAIPAEPFFELFDHFSDLERLFRKIIELAYLESIQRVENFQFKTAEERYTMLLDKSPHILHEIPLKHIASYLGITQVSLSRIRAGLAVPA